MVVTAQVKLFCSLDLTPGDTACLLGFINLLLVASVLEGHRFED